MSFTWESIFHCNGWGKKRDLIYGMIRWKNRNKLRVTSQQLSDRKQVVKRKSTILCPTLNKLVSHVSQLTIFTFSHVQTKLEIQKDVETCYRNICQFQKYLKKMCLLNIAAHFCITLA